MAAAAFVVVAAAAEVWFSGTVAAVVVVDLAVEGGVRLPCFVVLVEVTVAESACWAPVR